MFGICDAFILTRHCRYYWYNHLNLAIWQDKLVEMCFNLLWLLFSLPPSTLSFSNVVEIYPFQSI